MNLAIIGKFNKIHDEEYIAKSFEMLGHNVLRLDERLLTEQIVGLIEDFQPDLVIWTKLMVTEPVKLRQLLKKYKTVCWVFDLYWNYPREYRLTTHPAFTADYIFTTDGGNDHRFKSVGLTHKCVRQGIYAPECFISTGEPKDTIIFVGSNNTFNSERQKCLKFIKDTYGSKFKWYGKEDTDEVRGIELNELYANNKIVVGDSVYSPNYWSNRVVETLGRGGFLIHREVEGIKEEYPDLVTYSGLRDLSNKIDYYLTHEEERLDIIKKNFDLVKSRYTMDKKCEELLNHVNL
jgi:hypothetical protein